MDRFCTMVWDEHAPTSARQVNTWTRELQGTATRWRVVLDAPGLRLLCLIQQGDLPRITRLEGLPGIVVGTLFERGREKRGRLDAIDWRDTRRIVASNGEDLIGNFWGHYVALWREPETGVTTVMRDPCGGVSCFTSRAHGVDLIFAHPPDVAGLSNLAFTTNWTSIQAFLLDNHFGTRQTGLREIVELLPAERMRCAPHAAPQFSWAWNGASIAGAPDRQSFKEARGELRETAEACFAALGRAYPDIVVRLSGGLDSSILANLMRRVSSARITGLHLVGSDYEAFEAKLARLAAKHAGITLIEAQLNPQTFDLRAMLDAPLLARPSKQILGAEADQVVSGVCDEVGASAVMAGHGGDALFLQRGIAGHSLSDYLRLNGLNRRVLQVAYEAATLQERPLWSLLREAIPAAFQRTSKQPIEALQDARAQGSLLNLEAERDLPDAYRRHPWLLGASDLTPGKRVQLRSIAALHTYHAQCETGVARDALSPFFAQPLVEFALRTPCYVLVEGGVDRALERCTFSDIIPEAVALRTSKGLIDHHLLQLADKNLAFLRELILDGALVQQNWIDRRRVETALTPARLALGGGMTYLYSLAVAEAWMHSWKTRISRGRAAG